jgi:hypothetical protein
MVLPAGFPNIIMGLTGPIVLMVENYRTGLIWQLTRSPYIVKGLRGPVSRTAG